MVVLHYKNCHRLRLNERYLSQLESVPSLDQDQWNLLGTTNLSFAPRHEAKIGQKLFLLVLYTGVVGEVVVIRVGGVGAGVAEEVVVVVVVE